VHRTEVLSPLHFLLGFAGFVLRSKNGFACNDGEYNDRDCNDQKDEKENLRNTRGTRCDAGEPEEPRHDRDQEKNKRPLEHEPPRSMSVLSSSSEQAGDQRHDEQHEEYEKQDFGDFGGTGCEAPKTEQRSDNCNDKEHRSVVQHVDLLFVSRASRRLTTQPGFTPCRLQ
jgi:hypothetical protein